MAKGNYNWILGAGLGFALGGPLGAMIGGIIGSQLGGGSPGSARRGLPRPDHMRDRGHYTGGGVEGDLILSFLVLAAAIAKADQEVRSAEVQAVKGFLVRSFGIARASALMKLFREILEQPVDLPGVCGQIREEADDRFKRTVVQALFEIASADDELVQEETSLIREISRLLGVSPLEFNGIASIYVTRSPDRDYDLLEIPPSASDDQIKSKYRELVKKYHPDKSAGLGEEFKALAEKKFKEISAAYERIKQRRGMR